MAYELFDQYKGKWEIRQASTNTIATQFWRNSIAEYSSRDFIEVRHREDNKLEYIQLLESGKE